MTKAMTINNLINEAKKRYKVGDRFKVVHQPEQICTIKSFDVFEDSIVVRSDGRWHFNVLVIESQDAEGATVCKNGKWAEKVEPEKTPEQLAAELGFKIGDKVWSIDTKKYLGEIYKFYIGTDYPNLMAKVTLDYSSNVNGITNKVAIHCPTEPDKDFIKSILKIKHTNYPDNNVNVCFHVNGSKSFDYKPDIAKTHLILSVDEYMKSQGIEPLFVTEDGKNIYEGMTYYKVLNNSYIDSDICRNNTSPHLGFVYFKTEKEANAYHESIKPNTYTVELPKGYEVKREYVVLASWEDNTVDGIFLKLKHI